MSIEITFNMFDLLGFFIGVLTSVGLFVGIYKAIQSIKK